MGDEGANYQYQWKSLHDDVREIKQTLRVLSEAVTKLALVEERQAQMSQAVERAFTSIERVEVRLMALEKAGAHAGRIVMWIDRGVLIVLFAAFAFVARAVGLM